LNGVPNEYRRQGGCPGAGKAILRDTIKATVGFEKLGEATGAPAKSLMRMLGAGGNRNRATSSASSAICENRLESSCTSRRWR
jgi:hypothetical protein